MNNVIRLAVSLNCFFLFVSAAQSLQTFSSGDKAVSVVELYTSEGCSSCPPADRWLSALQSESGLWGEFIPMAFHVDYWDYIGWKDPYASRSNSQRQRRYAAEYRERTVYTPGVRRNGEEWRAWRRGAAITSADRKAVGTLSLSIDDENSFEATFNSNADADEGASDVRQNNVQLNIAVLGMGLEQEVTSGENEGRTLMHDFVVLGTASFSSAEHGAWSGQLPEAKARAEQYAVVAWVSKAGYLSPLQATGGLLVAN